MITINPELLQQSEEQIDKEQKSVDYDTREFTIEIIVNKYENDIDINQNEIFVPEYQREFVWDEERQSKFIESIILGLPIPLIFVAENNDGRLEIVDGSQRIRTLHAFLNNSLTLNHLEKLTTLNNFKFQNLSIPRQRKFRNTPIRMIVLSDNATEEVKNDMFERINRGSDLLKNMESRKGIYRGPFNDFIYELCATNEQFKKLAPMNKFLVKRQEYEELALRFFYLIDSYPTFPKFTGIAKTLDEYLKKKNANFNVDDKNQKLTDFNNVLNFVEKNFKYGFAKSQNPQVSRMYFEAISVGVHLALKKNPQLVNKKLNVSSWLASKEFNETVSGKYHTHTPARLTQRINYVKEHLCEG
ncbi:uncharacterized protein DUF262 [Paenibacillus pabuli]|uniref:Uncharacterized protein DUF262 n=1 Tax=Paenibacillus pabuli TaxID=1472 RepID=A0ABX9BBG0_9BACL|nr:DUF262 domain-containing protein [Paenibacillus pabuli]RAI84442.1 uncharacterized protein DUF262 [Paenibacillus pabuli]